MLLSELLTGLDYEANHDLSGVEVTGIATDSRKVSPGSLFVAIAGLTVDGHDFIPQALAKGCAALLVRRGYTLPPGTPAVAVVEVSEPAAVLGTVAAAFYGWPAHHLTMVGITGTNGKTTITYLLESLIRAAGGRPGVIGTVNYRYNDLALPASHTTPDALILQELLARMVAAGVTHLAMEVSSHALAQHRLDGVLFDLAIFTNLTRDHLDFHGDMENYFAAKEQLFLSYLKPAGKAVVCVEEGGGGVGAEPDWGGRLAATLRARFAAGPGAQAARLLRCGFGPGNDLHPEEFAFDLAGITATVTTPAGKVAVRSRLLGDFNLKNILAALGAGVALGLTPKLLAAGVATAGQVPGRFERIDPPAAAGAESRLGRGAVLVDYAHTPDALENTLKTLRTLCRGRLLVVFGCGGDRDAGKRPLMGEVAGRYADAIFLTTDNSRSEESGKIIAEIEVGLRACGRQHVTFPPYVAGGKNEDGPEKRGSRPGDLHAKEPGRFGFEVISDRRQAIRSAILHAAPDDVVVISGKGHETTQISRNGVEFFDDRLEAHRALAMAAR